MPLNHCWSESTAYESCSPRGVWTALDRSRHEGHRRGGHEDAFERVSLRLEPRALETVRRPGRPDARGVFGQQAARFIGRATVAAAEAGDGDLEREDRRPPRLVGPRGIECAEIMKER